MYARIRKLVNFCRQHKRLTGTSSHLKSERALIFWKEYTLPKAWYIVTLILLVVSTIVFFVFPIDIFPFSFARAVLGLIFVLFLPGFMFIKALFPNCKEKEEKTLDFIERLGLSVGMSLVITVVVVSILNWFPLGVTFVPLFLALLSLVVFFSLLALIRELGLEQQV